MKVSSAKQKKSRIIQCEPGVILKDKKTGELFIGVVFRQQGTISPRWASTETGELEFPSAWRFTLDKFEILERGQKIEIEI